MQSFYQRYFRLFLVLGITTLLIPGWASASGPIGDHVNNLQANLDEYVEEVSWLIGRFGGVVDTYEAEGREATETDALLEYWEAVDFHAAVESHYVPIYAAIWQGIFGVKESIERGDSVAEVRQQQALLEQALWQALGAVKLAAQYQQQGLLEQVQTRGTGPATPVETLEEVKHRLDRVVAKYAEQLTDEATAMVHDTYLNLFEGVEGELIEQDAELVVDLEKDFNVTLPRALQSEAGVGEVRQVVKAMQKKLDRAKTLLNEADKERKDVF